jgi:hypothetical protein
MKKRTILTLGNPSLLGEREEKRLLQEREVCAGAAGGEQLSQLAGLGSVEGDGRLRAKAALEKE